ncbi:MAG: twin-arginine translocation signal domain-containing protein [Cyanobacteria bacterium J06650_10]
MTTNRRNFLKNTAIGGSTLIAASSRSFFFPKPASAYSINYVLSVSGTSDIIFRNIVAADLARDVSDNIPTDNRAVVAAIQTNQQEFTNRQFNQNQTPYAQRLNNPNNPVWGRQRQEDVGPNPGFGTVQIANNRASAIAFTGSTTAGIDTAIQALGTDERIDPLSLDYSLIPVEQQFEDWGSWGGDVNPRTGQIISSTSLTRYATRFGHVIRRYQVVEPGPGGFGIISFNVDGGREVKTNIEVRVSFT